MKKSAVLKECRRLVAVEEKAEKDKNRLLDAYAAENAKFHLFSIIWYRDDNYRRKYFKVIENYAYINRDGLQLCCRAVPTTKQGERRGNAVRLSDATLSKCEVAK